MLEGAQKSGQFLSSSLKTGLEFRQWHNRIGGISGGLGHRFDPPGDGQKKREKPGSIRMEVSGMSWWDSGQSDCRADCVLW